MHSALRLINFIFRFVEFKEIRKELKARKEVNKREHPAVQAGHVIHPQLLPPIAHDQAPGQ
jgi:hypothetical protein